MQGVILYRVDLILQSLRNQLNLYPIRPSIHLPQRKVLSFGALFCAKNFPFFPSWPYFRRSYALELIQSFDKMRRLEHTTLVN